MHAGSKFLAQWRQRGSGVVHVSALEGWKIPAWAHRVPVLLEKKIGMKAGYGSTSARLAECRISRCTGDTMSLTPHHHLLE